MTIILWANIACFVLIGLSFGEHHSKRYRTMMREAALKQDLASMRKAIDQFYADKQRYPNTLRELVERHYLRRIPRDPITEKESDWSEIRDEQNNLIDVKLDVDGMTLDGVPYRSL